MTGFSCNLMSLEDDDPPSPAANGERELVELKETLLHLRHEMTAAGEGSGTAGDEIRGEDQHDVVTALYTELWPRLYSYLSGTMDISSDQATEIIQEAFLRLTARMADGTEIGNPHGWVVHVARQLAIDIYRRRDQRAGHAEETEDILSLDRIDPSLNQEELLLRRESIRRVNKALRQMNPHHRDCFQLRLRGFRYKDIGEAMNISEQRAAEIVKLVTRRLAVVCG